MPSPRLPLVLRVSVLAPLTLLLIVAAGLTMPLPPGPLCDEGMVLFMEGGCDWGESNVFFFSKLGLLLAVNFAFVTAWRRRVESVRGFLPHLAVLAVLSAVLYSGGGCDTYYSHPNGSLGQMTLEIAAFALLGIALLERAGRHGWRWFLPTWLLWNATYPVAFYLFLALTDHWTWTHTAWICGALAGPVLALRLRPWLASLRRLPGGAAPG